MLESVHVAAQYLAMAAKSFVVSEPDDSHTNLGWNDPSRSLISRELGSGGVTLALSYSNYTLEFKKGEEVIDSLELANSKHGENLEWLKQKSESLGLGQYKFDLHYELPYGALTSDYSFDEKDEERLASFVKTRSYADAVLKRVMADQGNGEVRIWPHHYDAGALIWVGEGNSIGIGMAISDSLISKPYFYVSGWKGHDSLPTHDLPELEHGRWMLDEWNGATFPVYDSEENTALGFFQQSISILKGKLE